MSGATLGACSAITWPLVEALLDTLRFTHASSHDYDAPAMPEATVLYTVTAAVVAALVVWVAFILSTAKEPWARAAVADTFGLGSGMESRHESDDDLDHDDHDDEVEDERDDAFEASAAGRDDALSNDAEAAAAEQGDGEKSAEDKKAEA